MDLSEWKKDQIQKGVPQYAHFDSRVTLKQCWNYISDPQKVSHHGFYPFIHYVIKNRKIKNGKSAKPKERGIYYAAHLDTWIYRYYAYKLNELYNTRVSTEHISNVAVAYRTNLGKSNIHFAHEAFQFIRDQSDSYVIIGDFHKFFDTLDHIYLKERLCDLLHEEVLPEDYYAVYKNVTKFSYWELSDLLNLNKLEVNRKGIKELNTKPKVLSPEAFHKYSGNIKCNPEQGAGVPQGSPISAVLANIYMLKADIEIHKLVQSVDGFYMRYSDDFMVVIPECNSEEFFDFYHGIKEILLAIPNLTLHDEKTKIFHVQGNMVKSCTNDYLSGIKNSKNIIDFLGFSYDGKYVTIRDKTNSKYYNRMYRKADGIVKTGGVTPKGKIISCKFLYERYSEKGAAYHQNNRRGQNSEKRNRIKGNYFDYVNRSEKVFQDESVGRGTKRHMQRIRKRLNLIKKDSVNRKLWD